MKRTANRISRRLVLRGAGGVVVALPFLESMARGQVVAKKRFVGMYMANGSFTPKWTPTNVVDQTTFTLPDSHAALAPLKEHVMWLGGLNAAVAVSGEGEQHQRGLGGLLTGAKLGTGNFIGNDGTRAGWAKSASIDQALVSLIGQGAPVPSVQLGVYAKERDVSGVLSYAGDAQPLLPENSPYQTFRTLFSDGMQPPDMLDGLRLKRASVLDTVLSQFNAVRRKVATSERQRLDDHAQKVRDLEVRVTAAPDGGVVMSRCRTPMAPANTNYESETAMPDAARLHLELLALAFACDATRIASVMFSDAKNHIAMPFISVNSDVHNISHYGDSEPTRLQLALRDKWVVEQLANFLTILRDTNDDVGTVLDNTLVFLGSDVAKGNLHSHDDMPFLVAGHATGWTMGRYLRFNGLPHNNLLLSMMQGYGSTATTFGDSAFCSGPLAGLV